MPTTRNQPPPRPQAFSYCESTDTIRLMPQNYLVARKYHRGWIVDADMAVPVELASKVFHVVHTEHSTRYGTGPYLLSRIAA